MKQIKNTNLHARTLLAGILSSGITPIFDLDGVLLNAGHRVKIFNSADVAKGNCTRDQIGQLDLEHYQGNTTHEQVNQDKNLPLMYVIDELNKLNKPYHVATARVIKDCKHSTALLKARNINPVITICRPQKNNNKPVNHPDYLQDSDLKSRAFCKHWDARQRENLVLIDDSMGNCLAAIECGLKAIHVNFEGH